MQNDNYRQWPNILDLDAKIKALEDQLELLEDEDKRFSIKHRIFALVSRRYDQIQFNKEVYKKLKETEQNAKVLSSPAEK